MERQNLNGINVIISGAGVGGLMAALECWRIGCTVRIFERTKANVVSGDSFTVGPSALNTFKHWPEMEKRCYDIAYYPLIAQYNVQGEKIAGPMEIGSLISLKDGQTRIARHMRPEFHGILLEQLQKMGIDVEYDKEVANYFEDNSTEKAGVIFQDGSRYSADLVIAADGVRSASWTLVTGRPVATKSSGNAVFRSAYPVEYALADPVIAEHFKLTEDGRSVIEMRTGANVYGMFWRNQQWMCWGLNHPDHGTAEESWATHVDPEEALKVTREVPGWCDVADRVIKATPYGLVDWKLMFRDPQPTWTSPNGHLVQLGDAAHTFLPSSGNGATQAVEDAVSLAACLAIAGKDNIPNATRVHNLLRFERVSFLQAMGVGNREARIKPKNSNAVALPKLGAWVLDHDPEQYAFKNYEQALSHISDGKPFQNTNRPTGVTYEPWTIEGLADALEKGEPTILDGDWS